MEKYNKFGTELKKLRIKSELTQYQLALKAGIDTSYLSKIENGLLPPPSEIILTNLAEALNINPAKLVRLSGRISQHIAQELEARAKSEFGPKLKDLRAKADMSQRELAESVNVNSSYISKLENGTMPPPSKKILVKLAAALNFDKDNLVVLAGKKNPRRVLEVKNPFSIDQLSYLIRGVGAMNMKSLARVAVALLLVITVGTSMWFAGPRPVQAVTVSFPSTPAATQNSSHTFPVRVDIAGATDLLPVQSIDIWVEDQTGAYNYTLTDVPLSATTTTYSPSGVGTVSVTAAPGSMWSYATSGATAHYGYGYGYSTGGTGDTYIVFTVTWTPPSSWPTGTYNTNAIVYGNGGAAKALTSDTPGSFTISAAAAGPGPRAPKAPPVGDPLVTDVSTVTAEFEVSGLVFPTMGVNIAEPATISAMVKNIGDIAGTYQVTLKINGEAVSSKTIKLNGGEYRKVSFTTVLGKLGDYKVEIDGLSGTLTVKAPAVAPVVPSAPTAPTAPVVPAAPAPVPAPTPWTAIIIVLVVAVIVGGILVCVNVKRKHTHCDG